VTDRRFAAHAQLKSLQAAYREDQVTLNLVLDAQRRLATAESRYYEALVEHTLAVKGLQFEKGTLLEYEDIQLAEGPWSEAAHADARELLEHRKPARDSRFLPEHRVITTQ
jgi:hypothetical protein